MFRDLKRVKQKLNIDECIDILVNHKRGVLAVNGDDGYPYCFPMNYYYNEIDNAIYFHSGKIGHKIDSIKKDNKASFCVTTDGIKEDEKLSWACTVKSVIIFGSIELIDNIDINNNELIDVIRKLCYKFTIDNDYIEKEISESLKNTIVLKLDIKNICGKKVLEA